MEGINGAAIVCQWSEESYVFMSYIAGMFMASTEN
jgi:hypothetical protein